MLTGLSGAVVHYLARAPVMLETTRELGAVLVALAAWLPCHLLRRPIFHALGLPQRALRESVAATLFLYPHVAVAFVATLLVSGRFDARTGMVLGGAVVLLYLVSAGRQVDLCRALGLLDAVPDRVDEMCRAEALRVGVHLSGVWALPSTAANAFAVPPRQAVVYTERALRELDADELRAIARHEIGHLLEPPRLLRLRRLATFIPLCIPLVRVAWETGGLMAMAVILLLALGMSVGRDRLSRRLERAADAFAGQEPEAGATGQADDYARALSRIYELNLIPLVLGRGRAAHPDLYDRLVAVGRPPDAPRPRAPSLLPVAVGVLVYGFSMGFGILLASSVAVRGRAEQAALAGAALGGGNGQRLSDEAYAAFQRGDRAVAARLYYAGARISPDDPWTAANLSITLGWLGRMPEARTAAEEARRRHRRLGSPREVDELVREAERFSQSSR